VWTSVTSFSATAAARSQPCYAIVEFVLGNGWGVFDVKIGLKTVEKCSRIRSMDAPIVYLELIRG
jgi:hypothetical protein